MKKIESANKSGCEDRFSFLKSDVKEE